MSTYARTYVRTYVRMCFDVQLALIISCYLGVAGDSGGDVKVMVGGVAVLCNGVPKQVLKTFNDNPEILRVSAPRLAFSISFCSCVRTYHASQCSCVAVAAVSRSHIMWWPSPQSHTYERTYVGTYTSVCVSYGGPVPRRAPPQLLGADTYVRTPVRM